MLDRMTMGQHVATMCRVKVAGSAEMQATLFKEKTQCVLIHRYTLDTYKIVLYVQVLKL